MEVEIGVQSRYAINNRVLYVICLSKSEEEMLPNTFFHLSLKFLYFAPLYLPSDSRNPNPAVNLLANIQQLLCAQLHCV